MVNSYHDWDMIAAKLTEVFRCVCIAEYLKLPFKKDWRNGKMAHGMHCTDSVLYESG